MGMFDWFKKKPKKVTEAKGPPKSKPPAKTEKEQVLSGDRFTR